MIKLNAAALAYAPAGLFGARFQRREAAHWAIGRLHVTYTQAAADDLRQMGLTVLTQTSFFRQAYWSSIGAHHDGCRSAAQRRG